ncbi:von Willebrand factor type A domain-containing protein [Neolewinella lacunae]|uniref:von Willebrand factor type A domain-containing protein n=1 Tax=Neolewinella lacunae TaxID=1517758 RepID=A0A923PK85_9BACT|nr:von Willebrand factor type A domain-containing protein [Neolewinella lacunae]MBC6993241.1 von Willebrand factor type A domain-containing protein [Neolewinella lacunae]MDN3635712.1 von Willebrand factor type A domain-containing protein [Neolewinella lacunae]
MKHFLPLLAIFFTLQLSAQADCISGIVVDDSGAPLIGVGILLKGTNSGAVSDRDGKFSLCGLAPAKQVRLNISYTGFVTQDADYLVGDSLIRVVMIGQVLLEEVVVTGYGTTAKREMSAAVVHQEDLSSISRKRRGPKPATGNSHRTDPESRESYNEILPNKFIATQKENTSTISTDVDRAAYANVRRFLHAGTLPPADAVRSEEMINYFPYEDPNPSSKSDIALRSELMTCPWNSNNQLLRISAKTMPLAPAEIPPSNLVFLLDVSGSMTSYNKLPLVKQSLLLLAQSLRPSDKVSIVVYAGAAGLVLPPTSNAASIFNALEDLQAGGSTAGGAGIQLAYQVATESFIAGGNNRIILATDGDFNVGITNQNELVKLIEEKRETGIYLTVLGFGTGNYQEGTMQLLANKGNGNHAYIDTPAEAHKVLVEEFGGTLYTVAKDVKLQLEFQKNAVAEYRLIGYENRLLNQEDFDDDTKDAAEMGAGHNVTVLYELVPAPDFANYQSIGELRLRYKPDVVGASQKIVHPITKRNERREKPSADLRWSAAVAEFAMLLAGSEYLGDATWEHCLELAENARGKDPNGYRAEMIGLIKTAQMISAR